MIQAEVFQIEKISENTKILVVVSNKGLFDFIVTQIDFHSSHWVILLENQVEIFLIHLSLDNRESFL